MIGDRLPLKKESVRTIDQDGHLHVSETPISKANVCGYLGAELVGIAGSEKLNLDPDRMYMLLRDPAALEKAASTFNGKPLLSTHQPVSADAHAPELTVGAVSNVQWNPPYLTAALDIWPGAMIEKIMDGSQKELSCGYFFTIVPESGTYEGEHYDARMTDITGNHVAIVEEGRAGPDVAVGDSKPKDERFMASKAMLSRKGSIVRGAMATYLRPKLAVDAKVDLPKLLAGTTAANYTARKPVIADALRKATKDKLAKDANLDDVMDMLDALDDEGMLDPDAMDAETDPEDTNPPAPKNGEPPKGEDADPMDALKSFLQSKLSPEDHAKACTMMTPGGKDEPPPFPGMPKPGGEMVPGKGKGKTEDEPPMTKGAMDAAIAAAARDAEKRTIARLNAIREAETAVRPVVGELAVAFDSAEAVYKHALNHIGMDLTDVPVAAYGALFKARREMEATVSQRKSPFAADSATHESFAKRFPEASRIRQF